MGGEELADPSDISDRLAPFVGDRTATAQEIRAVVRPGITEADIQALAERLRTTSESEREGQTRMARG